MMDTINDTLTDRNNAIFDHWLAGESEGMIASKGVASPVQVHRIVTALRESRLDNMECGETSPIYNVWTYSGCDKRFGQKHPGRLITGLRPYELL